MKERYFQEFLQKIEPFRDLWRSVKFVGYAGKIADTWILLSGRMQLSAKAVDSEVLSKEADFDTFFAFVDEFPADSFQQILHEIVQTENIHLNLGGVSFRDIRLRTEGDQNQNPLSWFNPYKFDRTGKNIFETEPVGFSWTIRSERQIATVPDAARCLEKASEQLRRDVHIDGVQALAKKLMPGLKLNSQVSPELQIVAPLPFGVDDTRTGGVMLTAPPTAQGRVMALKAFFYPEPQQPAERVISTTEYPGEDCPLHIEWKPEWPETATHATIHVFWNGRDIDALPINRWKASGSILGAVDEYFDSGHSRLCEALKYSDKKSSDGFELAVVRLLNVLGIPTIWYGKTVEDRADAAAIIQSDGSTVLLLIECTREKPAVKVSTLAARADHLRRSLQIEAEVLPIVFTAARVVDSEVTGANEHGVSLVGADEIEGLLKLISLPGTTTDSVVQKLRAHESIADVILGKVGRLYRG